uniref:Uncharacterized protein n=1 Tax=Trypanosoma congolense (strain IL3000) TaxID=1068625 RepID=G0UJ43_TRYCI|nr:conserved hypothetical protein [Trypanosoma congolense IL3000]
MSDSSLVLSKHPAMMSETAELSLPDEKAVQTSSRFHGDFLGGVPHRDNVQSGMRDIIEGTNNNHEQIQCYTQVTRTGPEKFSSSCDTQQEELVAFMSRIAAQESKLRQVEEGYEHYTRELQRYLAVAREERGKLTAARELLWTQMRALCGDLDEQRRAQEMVRVVRGWDAADDTHKVLSGEADPASRTGEERTSPNDFELKCSSSALEGHFVDVDVGTRSLGAANDSPLPYMVLGRKLPQWRVETPQGHDVFHRAQEEKHYKEEKVTAGSCETRLHEVKGLCELAERGPRLRRDGSYSGLDDFKLETQRAREEWLREKQKLETENSELRSSIISERLRCDKADESRQRAEASLLRTERELMLVRQREVSLQGTVEDLRLASSKDKASYARLQGEVERLLTVVAEREREAERWKCVAERLEWQRRIEGSSAVCLVSTPLPFQKQYVQENFRGGVCHFPSDIKETGVAAQSTAPMRGEPATPPPLPNGSSAATIAVSPKSRSDLSQEALRLLTPHRRVKEQGQGQSSQRIENVTCTECCAEAESVALLHTIVGDVLRQYGGCNVEGNTITGVVNDSNKDDNTSMGVTKQCDVSTLSSAESSNSLSTSSVSLQHCQGIQDSRVHAQVKTRRHHSSQVSGGWTKKAPGGTFPGKDISLAYDTLFEVANAYDVVARKPNRPGRSERTIHREHGQRDETTHRHCCASPRDLGINATSAAAVSKSCAIPKTSRLVTTVEDPTTNCSTSPAQLPHMVTEDHLPLSPLTLVLQQQLNSAVLPGNKNNHRQDFSAQKEIDQRSQQTQVGGRLQRCRPMAEATTALRSMASSACTELPSEISKSEAHFKTRSLINSNVSGPSCGELTPALSDIKGASSTSLTDCDMSTTVGASATLPGCSMRLTALQERFSSIVFR